MSFSPVLSVCIPTFNRVDYLKESLVGLLNQAEPLGVEICISDNHSSDGTADFLKEISLSHPSIRYMLNKFSVGIDENMFSAISMGCGHYILPLGDDDVLSENALSGILKELENECDVLLLNGWHTNSTLQPNHKHLMPECAGSSFERADEAFAALWNKMPFGTFLAAKRCFAEEYFVRFIGTSHAYTGAVWEALSDIEVEKKTCKIRCMEACTVFIRGGEKTWSKNAALIMLYEIPLWFSLLGQKEIYQDVISKIRADYLNKQYSFLVLANFRAIGQLDNSDIAKLGKECTPKQFAKLLGVSKIPIKLIKVFLGVINAIKTIKRVVVK